MSRLLISVAALGLIGAASLPLPASAAEQQRGAANAQASTPLTDVSSQYYWRRHYGYRHHRYWGPRYGYYRHPYRYRYGYYRPYSYGYYGHPYGYYRPGPFVSFGFGPFGFRAF